MDHLDKELSKKIATTLNNKLFDIRSAFYVWKYLLSSINTTVYSEKEVEENLAMENRHIGFFKPVIISVETRLITESYKLFETRDDTHNVQRFLKELGESGKAYLEEWERIKTSYADEIRLIMSARNNLYAHESLKEMSELKLPSIIRFDELLHTLSNFLSSVSNGIFRESWFIFEEESMQAYRDTKLLLENLKRGEADRIRDIQRC